jgi:hypothetical protein
MSRNTKKKIAYVAIQRKLLALIYTLWKKNEMYISNYEEISGNDESKVLFPVGFEKATKKVASLKIEATQDELPYNESSEVLFPVTQR